ncbi:MAG: hypothetical protein ACKO32_04820 [Planctomycetia bacterium]
MLFALLCLAGFGIPQDANVQGPVQRPALREPEKLFSRVAVIGASIADGSGLDSEVGARTSFAELVHAGLKSPHEAPIDLGTPRAWLQYDANLRQWSAGAMARKATLVIAPDVLWWAAVAPDLERNARMGRALSALERIEVPLLLGDLPDLSHLAAALPGDFPVAVGNLPTPEELKELRAQLGEWTRAHTNVVLVPVARLHAAALAGSAIELRGNQWAGDDSRRLLQKDRCLPALDGSLLFLTSGWDELAKAWPTLSTETIDWSIASVRARLMEQKSADRAEESARRRRAEESRRTPPPPPPEPVPPKKQPHKRSRGGGDGGDGDGGGEKGGRGGG